MSTDGPDQRSRSQAVDSLHLSPRLVPLRSLAEWKEHASPTSAVQWKEGRSALETARTCLAAEPPGLPPEVDALLASDPDFGAVEAGEAEPGALVPFDGFLGLVNLDLLLRLRPPGPLQSLRVPVTDRPPPRTCGCSPTHPSRGRDFQPVP